MRSLLDLFVCQHRRTTFPQGVRGRMHVTCLDCGKEFNYNWEEMRRDTTRNRGGLRRVLSSVLGK